MFQNEKRTTLAKADFSTKGSLDEHIKSLVTLINENPNYYTTSSCSGRIILVQGEEKQETIWLFVSHNLASLQEVKKAIAQATGEVWLRAEPMILHIACVDVNAAMELVNLARSLGFKRSGLQSQRKKVIEISSSEILDTIVAKQGKQIVSDEYLEELILQANKRLEKTWKKRKILETKFLLPKVQDQQVQ